MSFQTRKAFVHLQNTNLNNDFALWYSPECPSTDTEGKKLLNKVVIFVTSSFIKFQLIHWYHMTILS